MLLAGCVPLTRSDVFPIAFKPVDDATLRMLSDGTHAIRPFKVQSDGIAISAYVDESPDASGYLIFFCGSGYGAEPALRRLLGPVRTLKLNLVVFNYFDVGMPAPSVSQIRKASLSLYDAVRALPAPASRSIYVAGHSLGATFALDVAGQREVAGVFVAGPSTTPAEINAYSYYPLSLVIRFVPDPDVAQIDNPALARHVSAPTLVIGSSGDKDAPPPFTRKVFGALPERTRRKLVILDGVGHASYFRAQSFWRAVSEFFVR